MMTAAGRGQRVSECMSVQVLACSGGVVRSSGREKENFAGSECGACRTPETTAICRDKNYDQHSKNKQTCTSTG